MRYSKQREAVWQAVCSTDTHPTAEWIYLKLRRVMPRISLGTVYRNLKQLQEAGRIISIPAGERVRYDGNVEPHDHFHCIVCNRWYDVELAGDKVPDQLEPRAGFRIKTLRVEATGICPACAETASL